MSEITDEMLTDAIDRIARTADGQMLYQFLQRRLMGVPSSNEVGALQSDHGARSFAATLIGLMSKGIQDSGGRDGSSRPIIFQRSPGGIVRSGARGAGRRVPARVLGWDQPESEPGNTGGG